jgi:hypothetical protein
MHTEKIPKLFEALFNFFYKDEEQGYGAKPEELKAGARVLRLDDLVQLYCVAIQLAGHYTRRYSHMILLSDATPSGIIPLVKADFEELIKDH